MTVTFYMQEQQRQTHIKIINNGITISVSTNFTGKNTFVSVEVRKADDFANIPICKRFLFFIRSFTSLGTRNKIDHL